MENILRRFNVEIKNRRTPRQVKSKVENLINNLSYDNKLRFLHFTAKSFLPLYMYKDGYTKKAAVPAAINAIEKYIKDRTEENANECSKLHDMCCNIGNSLFDNVNLRESDSFEAADATYAIAYSLAGIINKEHIDNYISDVFEFDAYSFIIANVCDSVIAYGNELLKTQSKEVYTFDDRSI